MLNSLKLYILLIISLIGLPINAQGIYLTENTIFRNSSNEIISLKQFDQLMDTGQWTMKLVTNRDKTLKHIQLLKKTQADIDLQKEVAPWKPNKKLGKNAPDFYAKDVNGLPHSLSDYKGSVFLLYFFSNENGLTTRHLPQLISMHKKFSNNPSFKVLSVDFGNENDLKAFLKEQPLKFPVISNGKKYFSDYPFSKPNFMLINHKGEFIYTTGHFSDVETITKDIEKAISKIKN